MEDVVIIGAGASGLFTAILAAKQGAKVLVMEHRDKIGKKILMTGNGKCNLTNMNDYHGKYYSDHIENAYQILSRISPSEVRKIFQELGLYTKEKRDGGVYPVSEQAVSVLDVLRSSCEQYHVKILLNTDAKKIFASEHKLEYIQNGERKTLEYKQLVLATGGKTASATGSDGSGYYLSAQFGHKTIEPLPALVQLKCENQDFKMISGVRTQAKLSLYIDHNFVQEEEGELQLTDTGISGIPVFQFSRNAAIALNEKKNVKVYIDFLPYLSEQEKNEISKQQVLFPSKTLEDFLAGFLNKKLCLWICKQQKIDPNIFINKISKERLEELIKKLSAYPFDIIATNSFEQAQVTRGGISLEEVDENLQSKNAKDIYMTGELLDCDGICGGYNLQWAWATGYVVANAITQK